MLKNYIILFFILTVTSVEAVTIDKKYPFKKNEDKPVEDHTGAFDENTHLINLGIGFLGSNYYKGGKGGSAYTYKKSPSINLSYEQAWKPKLGPGYLGIGACLGYQHVNYRYKYSSYNYYQNGNWYSGTGNYYYEHTWNHFLIAARSAYHWDKLNSEKAEIYAGMLIGMRIQTYSFNTNDPSPFPENYRLNDNSVYPAFSVFAGARWYFAPKFALFGEAGYGISYLTGGVSFKF
ncbi:MAG: hypothetical protein H0W84_06775 [Bacteroidetes bacterium]|nr:hypothetical protein [Bacteroidota bacterium]